MDQFGDGHHLHRGKTAELGFDQGVAGDLVAHPLGRHVGDYEQPEGVLVALHHPAGVADHAGVEVLAALDADHPSGDPQRLTLCDAAALTGLPLRTTATVML